MARFNGLALALFARRRAGDSFRNGDAILFAGPAERSTLANARGERLDQHQSRAGAADESASRKAQCLAGFASSGCPDFDRWTLLYLFRGLRLLVFRTDHAATTHGLERAARQLDGPDRFRRRAGRHALFRVELGSNARTTVAFCDSAIDGCVRGGEIGRAHV